MWNKENIQVKIRRFFGMGKYKTITLEELRKHSRALSLKMQETMARVVKTTEKSGEIAKKFRQFTERYEAKV